MVEPAPVSAPDLDVAAPRRLNLGCGTDIRPGWINLDSVPLTGVDVVHDLHRLPLPFADGTVDEVECQDVLEHTDYVPILRDLHRILRPGGTVHVQSTHFTSRGRYVDPTHRTAFSIDTFTFFLADSERAYYFDFHFSSIARRRITFDVARTKPWNFWAEPLFNRNPRMQKYYEETFLSRLFPGINVDVVLVK